MSNTEQILTEIVEKIQIGTDFSVRHPDYPPLELEPEIVERFHQTPQLLQTKYLTLQVKNYLHDLYFSHSLKKIEDIATAAQKPATISNDNSEGIDLKFLQRLQQSNISNGYIDEGWQIVAELNREISVVVKDGLHLHIDRQKYLPKEFQRAAIGDIIPIYLPNSLVGRDTYIIVGNAGKPDRSQAVEIYFNYTAAAAVAIALKLTRALNKLGIPFELATLHNPELFDRYDSSTLCIPQISYPSIQRVLAEIYYAHQAEFSANIPIFTKPLAPGLGLAEVPPIASTFGIERCQVLAIGLLAATEQGYSLPADKLKLIHQEFATTGIDLLQPYLFNPESVDTYSI
jgi:HopA1 effector protein family